jgi:Cu-processing system permease protein
MTPSTVTTLAQRELSDALRNRWFVAYAVAFVVLSVALAMLVVSSAGYGGVSGFGRTSAALINLVLFLAPLMGLTLGAQALSSEREQGTMSYLLAQPVSPFEMFVAKFIGLAIAIGAAIVTGFALATLTMTFMDSGGDAGAFLPLTGLTVLLAWSSLAIGYLISSFSRRTMSALGIAVVVWLVLVLVGDLGLMGTAVILKLSPETLLATTLVNPLESYRIAAVDMLRDSMELLGPAGMVAQDTFGGWSIVVLTGILVAWLVGPLAFAYVTMRREEQR